MQVTFQMSHRMLRGFISVQRASLGISANRTKEQKGFWGGGSEGLTRQ